MNKLNHRLIGKFVIPSKEYVCSHATTQIVIYASGQWNEAVFDEVKRGSGIEPKPLCQVFRQHDEMLTIPTPPFQVSDWHAKIFIGTGNLVRSVGNKS
jgi:hypothetical protein